MFATLLDSGEVKTLPPFPISYFGCKDQPKKEKNKMATQHLDVALNVASLPAKNTEDTQRYHLRNRAWTLRYTKDTDLSKKFGMMQDPPVDAEDMIDRIKKGDYVLPEKKDRSIWDQWYSIQWIKGKKDPDGHKKAEKALNEAFVALVDDIEILSPAEGLEALRKFEKKDFH